MRNGNYETKTKNHANNANRYRRGRCPMTGKIRYRDHKEAVKALHRAKSAANFETGQYGKTDRLERRNYFCQVCSAYHLTSQEKRESFQMNKVA